MVFADEVGELVKSDGVYMNSEWRGESGNFMLGAGFDPAESETFMRAIYFGIMATAWAG